MCLEILKELANLGTEPAARGLRPLSLEAGALSRFETGGCHAYRGRQFFGLYCHAPQRQRGAGRASIGRAAQHADCRPGSSESRTLSTAGALPVCAIPGALAGNTDAGAADPRT